MHTQDETQVQVQILRLNRKIEKLKKRVKHYQDKCDVYANILNMHPRIEASYEKYQKELAERERNYQMVARLHLQDRLIVQLQKEIDSKNANI
uniref:Uncharacterized protein n=1 Tax=viral metagenome TaxID=1070528 RepID=A0A6C0JVG6_9ZZZZ